MSKLSQEMIKEFIDAVSADHVAAELMLVDHAELLNARYARGETILHHLAINFRADAVQFLVDRGALLDEKNDTGCTALMEVCILGNEEIAKILLSHGADPNAASSTFDTALINAVRAGRTRMVELLLAAGADPALKSPVGLSIFDVMPSHSDVRLNIYRVIEKYAPSIPGNHVQE